MVAARVRRELQGSADAVSNSNFRLKLLASIVFNESTAGADASVDMPKLHNIKLLIHITMT